MKKAAAHPALRLGEQQETSPMKKAVAAAICVMAVGGPACAQNATATGTGVGIANSRSDARSVAISGQGGTGVGTGGNPTANVTIQGTQVPTATTATINNTGTSTVKNVPSVFAPGLAAAGLETCLGSVSGGGSFVGTGFSFGTTIPDPGCGARLDARTLWSMGLKKAAVARLCLNPEINRSMPEVCVSYLPQPAPVYAPAAYPAAYASVPTESTYSGGAILLVEGSTGKERLCNDYNEAAQKCRKWAYTNTGSVPKKKLASAKTAAPKPVAQKPVVADPPPANAAHAEEKPQVGFPTTN
jgi:hypothetical protein